MRYLRNWIRSLEKLSIGEYLWVAIINIVNRWKAK